MVESVRENPCAKSLDRVRLKGFAPFEANCVSTSESKNGNAYFLKMPNYSSILNRSKNLGKIVHKETIHLD